MSLKVLYLPGVLGSNLGYRLGPASRYEPVWLDPPTLLAGGLRFLDLAEDGAGPGPLAEGVQAVANQILGPAYGPLAGFMTLLGWDVLAVGWDWRRSVLAVAADLWGSVAEWAAGQPIYIVSHSQGGLLGRALFGVMSAAGQGGQLARLVTIGTPHYGSMESVRLFNRLPLFYAAFVGALGWTEWALGTPGPAYLDAALASMPCWYELMCWAGAGPLFDAAPDQAAAIYDPGFYAGGNPAVSPLLLENAELVQGELAGMLPEGRLVCVNGYGSSTPFELNQSAPVNSPGGYLYTQEGDGLVTLAEATPPGAPSVALNCSHALLLVSPAVWGALAAVVPQGLSASVRQ